MAGNDSGVPITPETRWRLLLAISRDAALEPLDVRVAIELVDKLAVGARTRLDAATLATDVSASAVGVLNALERLAANGFIAVAGARRGYAGVTCAIILGPTALTGDDNTR